MSNALLRTLWLPVSIIVGGLIIGLIVSAITSAIIRRIPRPSSQNNRELLARTLRATIPIITTAIGSYIALSYVRLSISMTLNLQRLIIGVGLFATAMIIGRVVSIGISRGLSRLSGNQPTSTLLPQLGSILTIVVAALVIAQSIFGIAITPILTTLGVGALAVALALQETLANLFAGLYIILARKIRIGDIVKLDSYEGEVTDISWRNTTLKAPSNNVIVLPNSMVASSAITNYSLPDREVAVTFDFEVSYESDLAQVEQAATEVAIAVMATTAGATPNFAPFVRFGAFTEFGIRATVIMRATSFGDQFLLRHEFAKLWHQRMHREGISVPFASRAINAIEELRQQAPSKKANDE